MVMFFKKVALALVVALLALAAGNLLVDSIIKMMS